MSLCSWFALGDLSKDSSFVDEIKFRFNKFKFCSLVFDMKLGGDINMLKNKISYMFQDPCALLLRRRNDYEIVLINEYLVPNFDLFSFTPSIGHDQLKRSLPNLGLVDGGIPFIGKRIRSNLCFHAIVSCCFAALHEKSTEVDQYYTFYLNNELVSCANQKQCLEQRIQSVDEKVRLWDGLCVDFGSFEQHSDQQRMEMQEKLVNELDHAANADEKASIEETYKREFDEFDEALEWKRNERFHEREKAAIEQSNETHVCESLLFELKIAMTQFREFLDQIHELSIWSNNMSQFFVGIPRIWHYGDLCEFQFKDCMDETFNQCHNDLMDVPNSWFL